MKCAVLLFASSLFAQTHTTWSDYSGASDSSQYSALDQINRSNVAKLQVAWTFPTGDNNKYFFNPIVVDNVMYVLAKNNSIVALDASTGKEIWTHARPRTPTSSPIAASIIGRARTAPTGGCYSPATIFCAPSTPAPARRS